MRPLRLFALILLLAGPLVAQDAPLVGVTDVRMYGVDFEGAKGPDGVWRIPGSQLLVIEAKVDTPDAKLIVMAFRNGNLTSPQTVRPGPMVGPNLREFHLAGPDGSYAIVIDDKIGAWHVSSLEIGKGPTPPPPPPPPVPTSTWTDVIKAPAASVKLTKAEAKVFADAFRETSKGTYTTITAATTAAREKYNSQFSLNRVTELVPFREAIVAELKRLQIVTVDATLAEFVKLADALETL